MSAYSKQTEIPKRRSYPKTLSLKSENVTCVEEMLLRKVPTIWKHFVHFMRRDAKPLSNGGKYSFPRCTRHHATATKSNVTRLGQVIGISPSNLPPFNSTTNKKIGQMSKT